MSKIAKKPYTVPEGVDLIISGKDVTAKGSKGQLSLTMVDDVSAVNDNGTVTVTPLTKSRFAKAMWATTQRLIENLCIGVSSGFEKKLEINGVGYRANMQGNTLVMQLGFSHEVKYDIPEGVKVEIEKQTQLTVSGIDKQLVGQVAAKIRGYKKPEPYKGKGIKYADEYIVRKEGKKK